MAQKFFKKFRDPAKAADFPESSGAINGVGLQHGIMAMSHINKGALYLFAYMQLWRVLVSEPLRNYGPIRDAIRNDLDRFLGTSHDEFLLLANEYLTKPKPLSMTMLVCSRKIDYAKNKIGVINKKDFSTFIVYAGEAVFELFVDGNRSTLFPAYRANAQLAEAIVIKNEDQWYSMNRDVGVVFQHSHNNFHK